MGGLVFAGFGLIMLVLPRPLVRIFSLYRGGSGLALGSRTKAPAFGTPAVRSVQAAGVVFMLGGLIVALA